MSDEPITMYRVPFSYPFCDAIMMFFVMQQSELPLTRTNLSSGSCQYALIFRKIRVGVFTLRTTNEQETIITVTPLIEGAHEALNPLMSGIVALMYVQSSMDARIPLAPTTAQTDNLRVLTVFLDTLPAIKPTEAHRKEPSPDAPIEAWLDWREAELKRKHPPRSVSFSKLAEQSNYTEAQFKHASSARRRSKT